MTKQELIQSIIDFCLEDAENEVDASFCWELLIKEAEEKLVKEINKSRETMSNNIKQANMSKSKPVSRFRR